jgi:SanA protein
MMHLQVWKKTTLDVLVVLLGLLLACNCWIITHTQEAIYSDIQQVNAQVYGLVLGTSPKCVDGTSSAFFNKRMETAALLYLHNKVQYLILSGTYDRQYYNEPIAMQAALEKLGVPKRATILDMQGKNTLESIKNAKAIYGVNKLTIITQHFHGYRALYISQHCGINALVFMEEPAIPFALTRTWLRECLARVKALIDLHVLQKHRHPTILRPLHGVL